MTTLADVTALETAAADALTAYEDKLAEGFTAESPEAIALYDAYQTANAAAVAARTEYELAQHSEVSNSFDLDSSEAFYEADSKGELVSSGGSLNQIDLTDLTSNSSLSDAYFNTREGTRYYWTTGNTYTFGGSKDYSYGSSYTVAITEAVPKSGQTIGDVKRWDGKFPYDIVDPTDSGCSVDASSYNSTFDGELANSYHVNAPAAPFFFRKPEFTPSDNAVDKNVGHKYEYQLGDTYSVGVHQNTNEITIVDRAHSFESKEVVEEHSHVGVSATFEAHGMDVSMGIQAVDFSLDMTAFKFDINYVGAQFNYSYSGIDVIYENAKKRFLILDRPEFRISDDDLKTLTAKQITSVSGESIVLQVEGNQQLMGMPEKVMGGSSKWDVGDFLPVSAWYRALTGSSQQAEDELDSVMSATNFNSDRADEKISRAESSASSHESYSRLDIDKESIGFASYSDGNSAAEYVLNSNKKFVELNVRDVNSTVEQKSQNITQRLDVAKDRYLVERYKSDKKFGRIWSTGEGDGPKKLDADSFGIEAQAAENQFAHLKGNADNGFAELFVHQTDTKLADFKLDAKTSKAELNIQKDASNYVKETYDASGGKYTLTVNGKNANLDFVKDKATLSVKNKATKMELDGDKGTLTAKTTKVDASTSFTVDTGKAEVKSSNIKVGDVAIKPTEVKMPQAKVTIGKMSKIALAGPKCDIKGEMLTINGKLATISGNLIKLG